MATTPYRKPNLKKKGSGGSKGRTTAAAVRGMKATQTRAYNARFGNSPGPAAASPSPSPTPSQGFFGIGSFGDAAEALSGGGKRRRGRPTAGAGPHPTGGISKGGYVSRVGTGTRTATTLPDTAMRRPSVASAQVRTNKGGTRSNAGGAMRGLTRASYVKSLNKAKAKPKTVKAVSKPKRPLAKRLQMGKPSK